MRQAALRWGILLAGALLVLAALGYQNGLLQNRLVALRAENKALNARVRELEAHLSASKNPRVLLHWTQAHGFVPMAEGRWGP